MSKVSIGAVKAVDLRQVQKLDRTTRTRTSPGRINSDLPGSTRTEVKFSKCLFEGVRSTQTYSDQLGLK